MKYFAGLGKAETTCFIPGIGMMGYGQPHNTVKEVGTPLFARILILKDERNSYFILVHLEQAFTTLAIKDELVTRFASIKPEWKITHANVMVTSQHTHSAPGGYSHYPMYNFTVPKFQRRVFETICAGAVEAFQTAVSKFVPVNLHWGTHTISSEVPVAFNRSLAAFLQNPESQGETTNQAVNREMEGLSLTDDQGKLLAFINWFGVHCTSISSFNNRIHHDNKGVAAQLFEKQHPGTLAFFMQGAAGDISPNYVWDKTTKLMRGKFKDQYESAAFNGEIQFQEARKIQCTKKVEGTLEFCHRFWDMTQIAHPAHGVAFFHGTAEGPGIPSALANLLKVVSRFVRQKNLIKHKTEYEAFYQAHDPKDVLLDHRTGTFLGIPLGFWKKIPTIPDPTVGSFQSQAKEGALETLPWVPSVLPFQLVRIGPLLIAAVPGEITTISAKRLKNYFLGELSAHGIDKVVISSYANAYMGYITTPEEYLTQSYEAGHTVHGINTLKGIFRGFEELILHLQGKVHESVEQKQFQFPAEELAKRSVE